MSLSKGQAWQQPSNQPARGTASRSWPQHALNTDLVLLDTLAMRAMLVFIVDPILKCESSAPSKYQAGHAVPADGTYHAPCICHFVPAQLQSDQRRSYSLSCTYKDEQGKKPLKYLQI